MSSKVESILESLSELTLLEASELKKQIEEKFGVTASAPMMMAGAPAAGGGAPEAAAEKTSFDAVLTEAGPNKLQVVKAVKEITGLGLKEAKELVDNAPKPIKEGVDKATLEDIQKKISEAGGKVEGK
jgi:large subunit ribosomal protein L7/L12